MSNMASGKKGGVLVLVLLIMFVGAVILAGLFQYMGSSLLLATKGEENAVNYYAADSGIEDAIYWLQHGQEDEDLWSWNAVEEQWERAVYTLNYTNNADNNRAVDVVVKNNPSSCGDNCYLITSTATHNKSGASTKIKSYIRATPLEFWKFGEDAITTNCSAMIRGQKTSIQGNVTYVCDVTCKGDPPATGFCPDDGVDCCMETVNGTVWQDNTPPPGIDWWPETWAIAKYFEDQTDGFDFSYESIEPKDFPTLGPLYREGDLLISSSLNCDPDILGECPRVTLEGTVYVNGDLTIKGEKYFTLDLNDQVIFVEGNGDNANDIYIDQQCIIEGSGAIITIGDIYFEPKMTTGPDDFVFIMSLEGSVLVQPNGAFYGSIAGQDVDVQPNFYIERTDSADFWDTFPDTDVSIIKILTYDIIDR